MPGSPLIVRSKPISTVKHSNRSTQLRSSFSGAVQQWNLLTDDQRIEWQHYADTLTAAAQFHPVNRSGRSVFIANISYLLYLISRNRFDGNINFKAPLDPGYLKIDHVHPEPPRTSGGRIIVHVFNPNNFDIDVLAMHSHQLSVRSSKFSGNYLSQSLQLNTVLPFSHRLVIYPNLPTKRFFAVTLKAIRRNGRKSVSKKFQVVVESSPNP